MNYESLEQLSPAFRCILFYTLLTEATVPQTLDFNFGRLL